MTEEKEKTTTRKGVTRRQFIAGTVGGVVVGAAVGAVAGSLGFPKTVTAQPWLPTSWDYAADVVVLGTGHAGLAAAIAAADAGAKVIVLEKMDQAHEGGNSKVSGNMFWAPDDVTLGTQYIAAMQKGSVTDTSVFSFLAQGLKDNLAYITSLGGTYGSLGAMSAPEWPVYPGGSTVKTYGMTVNGSAPFVGGGHLWQLYMDNVTKRSNSITMMYSTPATGLIQNADTKEILGVTAQSGGTVSSAGIPTGGSTISVKASKAVILACGGFEFNFDMEHQYLTAWPVYGWGTPGNTGDGIKMAQKAGADLWHMNVVNGGSPACIVVPDYPYPIADYVTPAANGYIEVDKHGNRYVNETIGFGRHGWETSEFTLQFNGYEGDFLRIPTWLIFDETTRIAGPLKLPSTVTAKSMWTGWYSNYTWSSDNSAEIAKGWITQGTSIADLASKIATDPDNADPMGNPTIDPSGAGLQATVDRWNGFVAAKADADFDRPASTLAAIQTAPFYAVKLWPGTVNTQGGPRRNTSCQVLDTSGNPIPRLYSAGECGSFWGWTYNAGGNNGECLLTGRTAGTNAAGLTDWS